MMKDSIKILAFGDLAIDSRRKPFAEDALDAVRDVTSDSDLVIFNQEFPITNTKTRNRHKSNFLAFKGHEQSPILAQRAGFDLACFANNHTYNYLDVGIVDTKDKFAAVGIDLVGAGENLAYSSRAYFYEKNSIKIALLNFAEKEANCATNYHGGAAPIDVSQNAHQIMELVGKDYKVLVSLHTGIDFCGYPSPRVVNMCRLFIEVGASAVFCHHSHMVSGHEFYKGKPISYGLGNLLTNIIVQKECRYACGMSIEISDETVNAAWNYFYINPVNDKLAPISEYDHKVFFRRIERVNALLDDSVALEDAIKSDFLTIEKIDYYYSLLSNSSHFLRKTFRKIGLTKLHASLMKWKLSSKNIDSQWNLIRCDNHRDILDIIYNMLDK